MKFNIYQLSVHNYLTGDIYQTLGLPVCEMANDNLLISVNCEMENIYG